MKQAPRHQNVLVHPLLFCSGPPVMNETQNAIYGAFLRQCSYNTESGLTVCAEGMPDNILNWVKSNRMHPFFMCLQQMWHDVNSRFIHYLINNNSSNRNCGSEWQTPLAPSNNAYRSMSCPIEPKQWSTDARGFPMLFTMQTIQKDLAFSGR